jgi:hypothetical protein
LAMMDCPRCGFSQPKDQFCANCGVNLDQFKPAPRPFYEVWVSNPYVVGACCLLVVGMAFYFLKRQRPIDQDLNSNTITRDETFTEEQRVAREQAADERSIRKNNSFASKAQETQRLGSTAPLQPEISATEAAVASLSPSISALSERKLQVRFFEVGQKDLTTLFSKGQMLSETTQSRTVAFDSFTEIESVVKDATSLPGTKTSDLKLGEAIEVFFGNNDAKTGASWEMSFNMQINQWSNDILTYQFSGDFFFATREKAISPIELAPESHQLKVNGAIVVAGIVPHTISSDPSLFEGLSSPVKILGSPDFRESLTEFIIVLQMK